MVLILLIFHLIMRIVLQSLQYVYKFKIPSLKAVYTAHLTIAFH